MNLLLSNDYALLLQIGIYYSFQNHQTRLLVSHVCYIHTNHCFYQSTVELNYFHDDKYYLSNPNLADVGASYNLYRGNHVHRDQAVKVYSCNYLDHGSRGG